MMNEILPPKLPERNPETHKAHSRQVLWQVTVPLAIGVILALVFAVLATMAGPAEASLWADISLIFILIPLMVVALLFIALFAAMGYGVYRLLQILPLYARRAQVFVFKLGQRVRTGSDLAVEPILRIHSFRAGVRALRRKPGA
jgi:hypothetical protein